MSYLRGVGAVGIWAGDAAKATIAGRDWPTADGPTAGATTTLAGGRRRRPHSGPEAKSSTSLGHPWIREEIERVERVSDIPSNQNTKNYENVHKRLR